MVPGHLRCPESYYLTEATVKSCPFIALYLNQRYAKASTGEHETQDSLLEYSAGRKTPTIASRFYKTGKKRSHTEISCRQNEKMLTPAAEFNTPL